MRKPWKNVIVMGLCTCIACVWLLRDDPLPESTTDVAIPVSAPLFSNPLTEASITVYHTHSRQVQSLPLERYVIGVVAAEMPASYEIEALKAQAVAARTFALYHAGVFHGSGCASHEGVDICTSSRCCQGYADEAELRERWGDDFDEQYARISDCVHATAGEIVSLAGVPILALYHASSGGATENVEEVYSMALSYLRGVDSPDEETYPNYIAETVLTRTALQTAFRGITGAQLFSDIPLADQIEVIEHTASGRVKTVRVGLATISGAKFRQLTGIRSANFTLEPQAKDLLCTTQGYGHGVGMSQAGAEAMARRGQDYRSILAWYYTGAQITRASWGV